MLGEATAVVGDVIVAAHNSTWVICCGTTCGAICAGVMTCLGDVGVGVGDLVTVALGNGRVEKQMAMLLLLLLMSLMLSVLLIVAMVIELVLSIEEVVAVSG